MCKNMGTISRKFDINNLKLKAVINNDENDA